MAAGAFIIPDKAQLNMVNATGLLNAASFKLSLHTNAWNPNPTTMEVFADVNSEIAAGNGYVAGGKALSSVSLAQSAGVVKFSSAAVEWTATGGAIPAWRYGVLRAVGTYNGKVDPIVGYFLGDNTPIDIPATPDTNKLSVTPNTGGILTL